MVAEDLRKAARYLLFAAVGVLVAAALVALGAVVGGTVINNNVKDLERQVDDLQTGDTPVSTRARQRAAEQQFILCSRKSDIIDPDLLEDLAQACDGYGTLEEAYKTQNVEPRETD